MKNFINSVFITIFLIPGVLHAYNNLPSSAPFPHSVTLSKDCSSTNADLKNCADNLDEMLNWVWNVRVPSATSPLTLNIGSGSFSVPADRLFCDEQGYLTVRGSGHDNTKLVGGGFNGFSNEPVIAIKNCTDITFQTLTIRSDEWSGTNGSRVGVLWIDGGNSTWHDVTVQAATYGWYDTFSGCNTPGEHYWFGSRIHAKTAFQDAIAYVSACGDNWFFGGELKAIAGDEIYMRVAAGADSETENGQIQIFGSAVRVLSQGNTPNPNQSYGFSGLRAAGGGSVHMHGGIISVRGDLGTNDDLDVNGVYVADNQSLIHTPGTAFTVKAGSNGVAQRVKGNAQSPFQWPASTEPPGIVSITGNDTYIETDCSASGCQTVGNEPHMMIYSEACTGAGGPWFDTITNSCR